MNETEERRSSERRHGERREDPELPAEASALLRMVDFRIPLVWLLGGFLMAASVLIGMYFQLQQVRESLTELQATVKAGNVQAITIASEIALMRYRIENIENARARENGEPVIRR